MHGAPELPEEIFGCEKERPSRPREVNARLPVSSCIAIASHVSGSDEQEPRLSPRACLDSFKPGAKPFESAMDGVRKIFVDRYTPETQR